MKYFLPIALILLSSTAAYAKPNFKPFKGSVPITATAVGKQGNKHIFACIGYLSQYKVQLPGKIHKTKCHVAYDKKVFALTKFSVLKGAKYAQWQSSGTGQFKKAIISGKTKNGNVLMCRAWHQGALLPGREIRGACLVSVGNQSFSKNNYQVLTALQKKRSPLLGWYYNAKGVQKKGVLGGTSPKTGPLRICNAYKDGNYYAGMLSTSACFAPVNGKLWTFKVYNMVGVTKKGDRPTWSKYAGQVPSNAFIVGRENNVPVYACRAPHNSGVYPGRLINRQCVISFSKSTITPKRFHVLTEGPAVYSWGYPRSSRPVAKAAYRWVKFNGSIPSNAVSGGISQQRKLYLCRAYHNKGRYPGKVVGKRCNIVWESQSIPVTSFQVLTTTSALKWEIELKNTAIAAGYEGRNTLHICKAPYRGGIHPGKLQNGICRIPWGGKAIRVRNFSILTK